MQWEINQFIRDELGIPLSTPHELIEVSGRKGFEFYMIAFFNRHDTETGSEDEISLACYWPQNEKSSIRR